MRKALWWVALATFGSISCNGTHLTAIPEGSPTPTAGDPTAVISGPASAELSAAASFSGTGSFSPNGAITGYAWVITARPAGSTAQLSANSGPSVDFVVDLAGSFTLALTVTDIAGKTGSTTFDFAGVPSQGLRVELTWAQYGHADLDLHLVNLGQDPSHAQIFDTTGCRSNLAATDTGCDCHWGNCQAAANMSLFWFTPNLPADASLDVDNVDTDVPENITIQAPVDGQYEMEVHYFSAEGAPSVPVDATVNVYIAGALSWSGAQHFAAINQVWDGGTVTVASGLATFAAKPANLADCKLADGAECPNEQP